MSTEYPLTPFTDFATKVDFEDYVGEGWGPDLKPERREGRVPSAGNYEGQGEDNPYAT